MKMCWHIHGKPVVLTAILTLVTGCTAIKSSQPEPIAAADTLFVGGDIVTLRGGQPGYAGAVAVRDGKIQAVGDRKTIETTHPGPTTKVVDLGGRTLVPGFVDAHGHIFVTGVQALAANLLAAPDGQVKDIGSLQRTLSAWAKGKTAEKLGWIIGFGYDDAQIKEQRHPTRHDLDAVSKDIPVLAIHQSGHLAAVNSKALELAGITTASPNPPGGVIRREAGSQQPNGVLEESAFWAVLSALPKLSEADKEAIAEAGQALYLRYGYTTAQEGRATPAIDGVWESLAGKDRIKLDVVAYPDIESADQAMRSPFVGRDYRHGFRIGGVKLNQDGSPQGKTAWLTQPYFKPPHGQKPGYQGYPAFTEEQVMGFVDKAYANHWQIMSHVNGDAAVDQYIRAVRAAEQKYGKADRRPVAIHAQTCREDQIAAFKELGIFPSLFPMHTFYWGDWYMNSVLGPERARNISPTGWVMKRGMMFSSHHDAPVAFPDSMRVLSATVTRVARGSGEVIGPEHRVSPLVGLKAMTLWPAYQHFEEATKGSIEVGKVADFAVLSANPLKIDPTKIAEIKVLETIKGGHSVYRLDADKQAGGIEDSCASSSRCLTKMSDIGAQMVGTEVHRH